ncbi:MAG: hypothetical protein E6G04_12050 [Actinobacteria bacterium]|nr:MAG: hypothetical protein E6G04_12050 [Actinomycetota bacterium]
MGTGDQVVFASAQRKLIPSGSITPIHLSQQSDSAHVLEKDGGIGFLTEGWYEVLLRVDWDPSDSSGTRFSHTKIPGQEPLHSEAISSSVLNVISEGRQLLRGNSLFGPDRTTTLVLEVWQDSGHDIEVRYAELIVRELRVPWHID